jgi:hypothetical protein
MEEGKIATLGHSLVRLKKSNMYKNACATLGNTFGASSGSISAPFGEPVVLLVIERSGKWKRKKVR